MRNLSLSKKALVFGFGLFLAIQLVPVWLWQINPASVSEPSWNSPGTRTLAQRACFDCHSNETRWPLYSRIAPASWYITKHTLDGREALNFSEWGVAQARAEAGEAGAGREGHEAADEVAEVIREGEMPPANYLVMHPEARLTATEQQQLIDGLQASLR